MAELEDLIPNPIIRAAMVRMANQLFKYANSEDGRLAIDEFTTACYVIELGEPEEEVFV